MAKHFLVAASLLLASPAWADGVPLKDTVPHITVTGKARAEVVPDIADLSLGVRNERRTAKEATAVTARMAGEVVAAIKAHGIDAKDIKVNAYVSAEYDIERNKEGVETKRRLRGYSAYQSLVIRVRDLGMVGTLARELFDNGANTFQNVSFSYSKEKDTRRELQGAAMRDALAQARTYTESIGLQLGRALQVGNEIQAESTTPDGAADLPSRRAPPVFVVTAIPLEPGVQYLNEQITVVWEIRGQAP